MRTVINRAPSAPNRKIDPHVRENIKDVVAKSAVSQVFAYDIVLDSIIIPRNYLYVVRHATKPKIFSVLERSTDDSGPIISVQTDIDAK